MYDIPQKIHINMHIARVAIHPFDYHPTTSNSQPTKAFNIEFLIEMSSQSPSDSSDSQIPISLDIPSDERLAGNESKSGEERQRFGNQFQFVLSMIGFSIGFGNVWRFPYLVYYVWSSILFILVWWSFPCSLFPRFGDCCLSFVCNGVVYGSIYSNQCYECLGEYPSPVTRHWCCEFVFKCRCCWVL